MDKSNFTNPIINILGGLVYVIVPILYQKEQISFITLIILTTFIVFFMGVLPWVISSYPISFHKKKFDETLDIINRFKHGDLNILTVHDYPSNDNKIRNRYNKTSFFHPPLIFYQLRFKPYLNWVDMHYIHLLKNFAKIGYKIYFLIHDFPYETDISNNGYMSAQKISLEYDHDLKRLIKNCKNIIGPNCTVLRASEFQASRGKSKIFVELVHNKFVPFFANHSSLFFGDINGKEKNKNDITHTIRYLFGFSTLYLLPKKRLIFHLTWEGRKEIWQRKNEILGNKADEVFIIYGVALSDRNGMWINMNNEDTTINFTDTDEVLKIKIEQADEEVLRTISQNILFPDENVELWNSATLIHNTTEGIIKYKKENKIEEHL